MPFFGIYFLPKKLDNNSIMLIATRNKIQAYTYGVCTAYEKCSDLKAAFQNRFGSDPSLFETFCRGYIEESARLSLEKIS